MSTRYTIQGGVLSTRYTLQGVCEHFVLCEQQLESLTTCNFLLRLDLMGSRDGGDEGSVLSALSC